jgi:hypothetical protein
MFEGTRNTESVQFLLILGTSMFLHFPSSCMTCIPGYQSADFFNDSSVLALPTQAHAVQDCITSTRLLVSTPTLLLRPISTQEIFPRPENFPKISLLKVQNFQLQNFFPTENLCRPIITFYKIFFMRKIFLSGNGP